MSIAIKVENLSKTYQLGEIGTGTISQDLHRWWSKVRGKDDPFLKIGETNNRTIKGNSNIVYSLQDINFEIQKGDAVGIVGKNGAGKSTLLKILSRVTSPSNGNVKLKGRVASLLEVGTGFHPELSGRENIFLNGSILGMRKKEISQKLDEIIDFSGVERYIDTPVKRYSSGMYVRLAFAVAAHLESEILIVDEVLAVGDAEFQNKCIGKMDKISKGDGRTLLFVSHNMIAVKNLCKKALYLENGNNAFFGSVNDTLNFYTEKKELSVGNIYTCNEKKNHPHFKHISTQLKGSQPKLTLELKLIIETKKHFNTSLLVVDIFDNYGTCIYQVIPSFTPFITADDGIQTYVLGIELIGLKPGQYDISIWLGPDFKNSYEWLTKVVCFQISDPPEKDRTMSYLPSEGFIVPTNTIQKI